MNALTLAGAASPTRAGAASRTRAGAASRGRPGRRPPVARRARKVGHRPGQPRSWRLLLVAVALLAALARPAAAQDPLDRLGRILGGAARIVRTMLPISTDKEVEIGRGIAATIAGRYPIVQDSALTLYVNLVGLTVAGEQPRPDVTYHFAILETPDVNAFAAPGGYIFVTRGALALMESEAELAGVLAHEVGHVNRRHVIEGIRKSDFWREVRDQSGISGTTLDRAVGAGSNVVFSGYSREDEAEADSLGVEYAASAGYDPEGLPTFVSHLSRHSGEGPLAEITATHESPAARIERLHRVMQRDSLPSGGATLAERFAAAVHPGRPAPR
jgi:predicted Zn-dependent protease